MQRSVWVMAGALVLAVVSQWAPFGASDTERIDDLEDRMSAVERRLDQVIDDSALNDPGGSMEDDVEDLEDEVSDLRTQVAELEDQVEDLDDAAAPTRIPTATTTP